VKAGIGGNEKPFRREARQIASLSHSVGERPKDAFAMLRTGQGGRALAGAWQKAV
jgi:hypothetical protein